MKHFTLIILFIFSSISAINAQENDRIKVLDAATFKDSTQQQKVQLVDVRTAKEYTAGNLAGSLNIDYYKQDEFKASFKKLDKTKPVYIYCRSGGRSHKAALLLEEMGFTKIYDLKGGYMGLK